MRKTTILTLIFLITGFCLTAETTKLYRYNSNGQTLQNHDVSNAIKQIAPMNGKNFYMTKSRLFKVDPFDYKVIGTFEDDAKAFHLSKETAAIVTSKEILFYNYKDYNWEKDSSKTIKLLESGGKVISMYPIEEKNLTIVIRSYALQCYDNESRELEWSDTSYIPESDTLTFQKIAYSFFYNKCNGMLYAFVSEGDQYGLAERIYGYYVDAVGSSSPEWYYYFADMPLGALAFGFGIAVLTDEEVIIFNISNERIKTIRFEDPTRGMVYFPNKNLLAVITDEELICFEYDRRYEVFDRIWSYRFVDEPIAISYNLNGSKIFVATDDEELIGFDLSGNRLFTADYEGEYVKALAATDDGGVMIISSTDCDQKLTYSVYASQLGIAAITTAILITKFWTDLMFTVISFVAVPM
jgi:hypothetical protein